MSGQVIGCLEVTTRRWSWLSAVQLEGWCGWGLDRYDVWGPQASQVALVVKSTPAHVGDIRDVSLIPGSGRFPWRRAWQPTSVFLPEGSHGQRSLAVYIPVLQRVRYNWNDLACTHLRTMASGFEEMLIIQFIEWIPGLCCSPWEERCPLHHPLLSCLNTIAIKVTCVQKYPHIHTHTQTYRDVYWENN